MGNLIKSTSTHNLDFKKDLEPTFFVEVPISKELAHEEKSMIEANRFYPAFADCNRDSFIKQIVNLVRDIYKFTGYVKDVTAKDMYETSVWIMSELQKDYPRATIKELEIAFHEGVRGKYGEFMGLGALTFCKWISFYFDSDYNSLRLDALRKQIKFEEKEELEKLKWKPTEKEKSIIEYFGIVGLVDIVNDEKFELFQDPNSVNWKTLKKIKILPDLDEDTQEKFWKAAQTSLLRKKSKELKSNPDSIKTKTILSQIQEINLGKSDDIITECRRLYLMEFIKKKLKKEGIQDFVGDVREKLLGNLNNDEIIKLALKLKLRPATEFFKTKKEYEAYLKRIKK